MDSHTRVLSCLVSVLSHAGLQGPLTLPSISTLFFLGSQYPGPFFKAKHQQIIPLIKCWINRNCCVTPLSIVNEEGVVCLVNFIIVQALQNHNVHPILSQPWEQKHNVYLDVALDIDFSPIFLSSIIC